MNILNAYCMPHTSRRTLQVLLIHSWTYSTIYCSTAVSQILFLSQGRMSLPTLNLNSPGSLINEQKHNILSIIDLIV